VEKAIILLKHIYIHLGPQLKNEQSAIHVDLISNCMDRLKVSYDTLTILTNEQSNLNPIDAEQTRRDEMKKSQEIKQILRVMIVLREYIHEFDANFLYERVHPPLFRFFFFVQTFELL
jgi:ubiquitin carboxyl-terminal hydrolase 9/24